MGTKRTDGALKVIFVAGTELSGSTFLNMVLANDPKAFACGEAAHYLLPTRPDHPHLRCACGDPDCRIWQQIKDRGADRAYETILDLFPEIGIIVDSSKNPFWISQQSERLAGEGIRTKRILIWKTPLEIAHSFNKRGHVELWERQWVNYHRLYASLVSDWRAVKYRRFVEDLDVLERACDYLEIPFFTEKKQYWEKVHHVIGGNHAAKIHLYAGGSSLYESSMARDASITEETARQVHRKVYYQNVADEQLQIQVAERVSRSAVIGEVLRMLEARDVSSEEPAGPPPSLVRMSWLAIGLRKLKRETVLRAGRLRYG
jgi:hypothetical protein